MKSVSLFAFALVPTLFTSSIAAPVPAMKETAKTQLAKLTGKWKAVSLKRAGVECVLEGEPVMVMEFKNNGEFEWIENAGGRGAIAHIDPSKYPSEIDYMYEEGVYDGKVQKGIYKLDGDTFTDCVSAVGEKRPTEIKSTKENKWTVIVYKRIKNDH